MADLIRFVDSVVASPTLRLDLNDETSWWVKSFDAPPPRLRRSMSENAMRDGVSVGSSSYGSRTLTIELECRKSTQDLAATEIQKLWRELDRPDNWLMYQPTGATKPVFFRTFRSDASQLADVIAQAAMRTITIELLAEPHALGLRETLGPYTVNNDPAHASNGCYLDVTGVLGDVPTPFVLSASSSTGQGAWIICARQTGTPSTGMANALHQVESGSLGTDTTNPGGGPDAAMSGTGTNNFARTSFATVATMATRVSLPDIRYGTYHLLAVVRRSDTTSSFQVRWSHNGNSGETRTVQVPASSAHRILVDLGLIHIGAPITTPGYSAVPFNSTPFHSTAVQLQASRVSGAGTLDWDFAAFAPADEQYLLSNRGPTSTGSRVIDGYNEAVVQMTSGSLFAGGIVSGNTPASVAGGFPQLVPNNQTNRFYTFMTRSTSVLGSEMIKGDAQTLTFDYWPRYLLVRPAST